MTLSSGWGLPRAGGVLDIQSLARNVGEVLGVFAEIAIPEKPSILNIGYSSSVKIQELGELENLVKTLWSPQWPADFPKIDQAAATKGAALYQTNCLSCHVLINRTDPNRKITAVMMDVRDRSQSVHQFLQSNRALREVERREHQFRAVHAENRSDCRCRLDDQQRSHSGSSWASSRVPLQMSCSRRISAVDDR